MQRMGMNMVAWNLLATVGDQTTPVINPPESLGEVNVSSVMIPRISIQAALNGGRGRIALKISQ